MDFKQKIAAYSIEHYKIITVIMVLFTLLLGALIPLIKRQRFAEILKENIIVTVDQIERSSPFGWYNDVAASIANTNPDFESVGIVNENKIPSNQPNRFFLRPS